MPGLDPPEDGALVFTYGYFRIDDKVMHGFGPVSSGGASVWVYRGVAWILISLILAIAGPYGSVMGLGFWERLGYWTSVNGAAILIASYVRHAMLQRFPHETLGVLIGIALVQSPVLAVMVWWVNVYVFRFDASGPVWLAELALITLLVCLCVALIRYEISQLRKFAAREAGSLPGEPLDDPPTLRPGFLDRSDAPLEGQLLVVSAADHYLDVVTTEGRGRVLMRFRDALSELDDVPGYRIHRSHWVARSELQRVRQVGRRHVADLRSGKALPVSDAYVEDLREAGLLSDPGIGNLMGTSPGNNMSAPTAMRRESSGRSQNIPPV